MTIALVVPVLNRFDLFTEMMATVDVEVRLYVMDSWRLNGGVSYAWNTGILRAKRDGYKYALVCNDDITFSPGAIERLMSTMEDTGATLVSPNQNGHREMEGLSEGGADFFCFLVDIDSLLDNCGLFDSTFWPAYFEDNDMHWRMRQAGVLTYIDNEAVVYHAGSATQNAIPEFPVCPPEQFLRNRDYFVSKWGGEPGHEKFTTPYNDSNLTIKQFYEPFTPYAAEDVL
jgi:glycosyltransferase involved in cell wall biosynthesis